MIVRAAAFDEVPMAAKLRARMAREMGGDWDVAHPGWRTKFAQYFGGRQGSGRAQVFLAFDRDEPVGMTIVPTVDDYRGYALNLLTAYVNAVYVLPSYRRRGIARELMRLAVAWARERKCFRVRLRASDDGQALYEAFGFAPGREMELKL